MHSQVEKQTLSGGFTFWLQSNAISLQAGNENRVQIYN